MNPPASPLPVTVIFATDNNYSQHLAVTILSLLESNPREALEMYIILIDVEEKHQAIFRELIAGRPLVKLTFITLDASVYSQFPVNGHISWATYARIFIPNLLPTVSKALYLDCDLYIADSIRPLWETDLGDYALGAIVDPLIVERQGPLGLPLDTPYYNAGVLLMNLDVWRRDGVMPNIIEYINGHISILRFHDQDALNAFLHKKILTLDPRWNVLHSFFEENAERVGLGLEAHARLKKNPGIVHFTSDRKPWFLLNSHPFRRHYWRILKATPYRTYRPPLLSARKALPEKYRIGKLLAKFKGR